MALTYRALEDASVAHPRVVQAVEIWGFLVLLGLTLFLFGLAFVCLKDRHLRQLEEERDHWAACRMQRESGGITVDWKNAVSESARPGHFKPTELQPLGHWYATDKAREHMYRVG